jgi:hypothetical protein
MSEKTRTNVSKEIDKEGKETVTFRKSWDKKGIHHSVEVKKVEGGYIIVEEKYGTPRDEEGKESGEYISEREEKVSLTNPFKEGGDEKEEGELTTKDAKMFSWIDKPSF